MAGLRNRLVHLYWEIDDELIYQYIQANLNDFDEYNQAVLSFLRRAKAAIKGDQHFSIMIFSQ